MFLLELCDHYISHRENTNVSGASPHACQVYESKDGGKGGIYETMEAYNKRLRKEQREKRKAVSTVVIFM